MTKKRLIVLMSIILVTLAGLSLLFATKPSNQTIKTEADLMVRNTSSLNKLVKDLSSLNNSLDQSQEPKASYTDYLRLMDDISNDCRSFNIPKSTNIELSSEAANLAERSTKVCDQIATLSGYSSDQFKNLRPVFTVPSSAKNYLSFPIVKSINDSRLNNSLTSTNSKLKAFGVDQELDNQSTRLLQKVIEVKLEEANKSQVEVDDIREAQQQLIAVRVDYWKSFVGLNDLNTELKNQLSAHCNYLNTNDLNLPKICKS